MARLLVCDKLSERGMAILKKTAGLEVVVKTGMAPEELRKTIESFEGVVIRSATKITKDIIESARALKVIGRAGIGVDNVDLEAATKRGIVVMNTPSGNAVTTAEHAIAMMFAVSRKIPQATASLRGGKWEKGKFQGSELSNKTLGVIGLGNIGRIVADRAIGLKMKVIAFDPFVTPEAAEKMGVELVDLADLYRRADYITVHTPLNEKTRNLIDRKALGQMKKGVYVVNCARGGIVNEGDLATAIGEGRVAGAGLDVFEKEPPDPSNPLLKSDAVIFTPHLGAATEEAQENVAIEIAEQMSDYFARGIVRNAVNFPCVSAEALELLRPYIGLAEKLGSLQGQLASRLPTEVAIEYRGEITGYNLAPVTQALLKGIIATMVDGVVVNYVNAPYLARERGMRVVESKVSEHQDFTSLVTVTVKNDHESRKISGTIFGKTNPRIVQIDGFYLEALPEGTILVIHNHDRPGVVGNVGTFLGKNSINISRMQLGLEKGKAEAIALYNVDGDVSPKILDELAKLPNIISVKKVIL